VKTSVIIVNYHTDALAVRAAGSVLEQGDAEVFVVDNSPEVSCWHNLPAGVQLLQNQENEGFARGCNRAYRECSGEFVLLLNPDAYLAPGALERLEGFLASHTDTAAVAPRIYWDDGRRILHPPTQLPGPRLWRRDRLAALYPVVRDLLAVAWRKRAVRYWRAEGCVRQDALSGGVVLLRRKAVEDVGGLFDERFFLYYEDSDLFMRLNQGNWRSYMFAGAEAVHYHDQSNLLSPGASGVKGEHMFRSGRRYAEKHFGRRAADRWVGPSTVRRGPDNGFLSPEKDASSGELVFPVPGELEDGWLLLVGRSPELMPAGGVWGTGLRAFLPGEVVDRLTPGVYHAGIFGQDGRRRRRPYWRWTMPEAEIRA